MTTGPTSQCLACAHYRSPFNPATLPAVDGPWCAAFPQGIPVEVFDNEVDHRQPYPGDRGVRWESNGKEFPQVGSPPVGPR